MLQESTETRLEALTAYALLLHTFLQRPSSALVSQHLSGSANEPLVNITMSNATDLALLQSSLQTLLRPLPPSNSLPRSVEQQLQTTLQRDLKLRLSAGGMRKCVEQLEGLREAEVRRRERKRAREEKDEGRVRVRRDDVDLQGWPRKWPGVEQGDEEARWVSLRQRTKGKELITHCRRADTPSCWTEFSL